MKSNEERLTMSNGIILEEGDKFFETDIFTDEEEFIGEVVYDKDFDALIIVESNRAFCLTAKEFMRRHPRADLIKKGDQK